MRKPEITANQRISLHWRWRFPPHCWLKFLQITCVLIVNFPWLLSGLAKLSSGPLVYLQSFTYQHKKREQKNILAYLGISKRCPNVSLEQADDDVEEVVRDETTETLSEHSESLFRVSPTLPPPALATGWWWG